MRYPILEALDVLLLAVSRVEVLIFEVFVPQCSELGSSPSRLHMVCLHLDDVRSASQIPTCSPSTNCREPGCDGTEHLSLKHSVQIHMCSDTSPSSTSCRS